MRRRYIGTSLVRPRSASRGFVASMRRPMHSGRSWAARVPLSTSGTSCSPPPSSALHPWSAPRSTLGTRAARGAARSAFLASAVHTSSVVHHIPFTVQNLCCAQPTAAAFCEPCHGADCHPAPWLAAWTKRELSASRMHHAHHPLGSPTNNSVRTQKAECAEDAEEGADVSHVDLPPAEHRATGRLHELPALLPLATRCCCRRPRFAQQHCHELTYAARGWRRGCVLQRRRGMVAQHGWQAVSYTHLTLPTTPYV